MPEEGRLFFFHLGQKLVRGRAMCQLWVVQGFDYPFNITAISALSLSLRVTSAASSNACVVGSETRQRHFRLRWRTTGRDTFIWRPSTFTSRSHLDSRWHTHPILRLQLRGNTAVLSYF